MRAIVVLEFDLPSPDDLAEVVKAIDPPRLPHIGGEVHVAIRESAAAVVDYLRGDRGTLVDAPKDTTAP